MFLAQTASLVLAYMPACDEVSGLAQAGEMPARRQTEAIEACMARASQLHQAQTAVLRADTLARLAGKA